MLSNKVSVYFEKNDISISVAQQGDLKNPSVFKMWL